MEFKDLIKTINEELLMYLDDYEVRQEHKFDTEPVYRTYDKVRKKTFGFAVISPKKPDNENIACVMSNVYAYGTKMGREAGIESARIKLNELK